MDPITIAQSIREDIESVALPPGAILKQEFLAERFKVSRQPIRQALEHLLAAGLLRRRSDRSLEVTGLTEQEARELLSIRKALETMALRGSAETLDAATLRRASRIAKDIEEEEDPAILEDLDVAFHRALYLGCGNVRLLAMVEALRREGRRIYARQPHNVERKAALQAEHHAILAACLANDVEAAVTALSTHIDGGAVDLIRSEV